MKRALVLFALALVHSIATAVEDTPELSTERVVLGTDHGDLVLALYPRVAPLHSKQILQLVELGVYDTTHFYRIERGFVAQTSTAHDRLLPLNAEQASAIKKIPAEFSDLRHVPGIVSMARDDGDIDSAETSFSILVGTAPHLDGQYTIFGELVEGQEVLDHFFQLKIDADNRPEQRLTINRAFVVNSTQ